MNQYFLNISEEDKKSIREKQRSIYDGYQTMESKVSKETPLYVENLALDEKGITVNNEGEVSEYKNIGINKKTKKKCNDCGGLYEGAMCECGTKGYMEEKYMCEACGGEMNEGKMCECGGAGMKYSMEEIGEGINLKSKKGQVYNQINESLDWFRKLSNRI